MDILNLVISLISGAVGGNVAGAATSTEKNLGGIVNTILGLVGGGAGQFILKALGLLATTGAAAAAGAPSGSEFDIASLLTNIGVSGVSGGALTAIIAQVKSALDKK